MRTSSGRGKQIREGILFAIGLFLFALAIRVFYAATLGHKPLSGDEIHFDAVAWNLARGNGFAISPGRPTAYVFPLHPIFLSIPYALFGHDITLARFFQAVLSSLSCVLIYILAMQIYKSGSFARIAGIISSVYPGLIIYSARLLNETLLIFFLLLCFMVYYHAMQSGRGLLCFLSGLLAGSAVLVRGEFVLLMLALGLWMIRVWRWRKGSLFLLALAAGLFPWVIRNYFAFGSFPLLSTRAGTTFYNSYFLSDKGFGFNQFEQLGPDFYKLESEVEQQRYLIAKTLAFIMENPLKAASTVPIKVLMTYYPFDGRWYPLPLFSRYNLAFVLVATLFFLGALWTIKRKEVALYPFLFPFITIACVNAIFYGKPEYRIPLVPFMILFVPLGVKYIKENYTNARFRRVALSLLIGHLLLFSLGDRLAPYLRVLRKSIEHFLPKG